MQDAPTSTTVTPQDVRRVVLASFIGTMIEWYDFFLYGFAAAAYFDELFFPDIDPFYGRMASFGTFAIGFFARPFGGVIFGHFGDRIGRKAMLVTTLMMMGIATCLIGLLPTYHSIGIAAPILLVILRIVQGFGVGGEWGGAVLMAVEHAQGRSRGLLGSLVQTAVPAGQLVAVGVLTIVAGSLDEASLLSWGWRVPFLLSICLLALGMFIRIRVMESPLFANVQQKREVSPSPFLEVLRRYRRNVVLTMGARLAENSCFYIFTVWVIDYAGKQLNVAKPDVLTGVFIASAVQLIAIPAFGRLSDRVGRRPVYLAGAIFIAAFAFPFFWLVETRVHALIWLSITIGLVGHAAMYGPQAAFFSELFGTNVRYSGASIGYQLASPLAGGLAPLIATALVEWSHGSSWPVSAYLIMMAGLTLTSVYLAAETFDREMEDPH